MVTPGWAFSYSRARRPSSLAASEVWPCHQVMSTVVPGLMSSMVTTLVDGPAGPEDSPQAEVSMRAATDATSAVRRSRPGGVLVVNDDHWSLRSGMEAVAASCSAVLGSAPPTSTSLIALATLSERD